MAVLGARSVWEVEDADNSADLRSITESRLIDLAPIPPAGEPSTLFDAARAALLGPGKRMRPVLAMLACQHVGGRPADALDFGCALEMAHAASLILDDLPCMDDAALRRGAPSLHKAHGEDAAILAAIALLNHAYGAVLNARDVCRDRRFAAMEALVGAIGFSGLAQGQMRDLRDSKVMRDENGLRRINQLKTSALFIAAMRGGGEIGGATQEQIAELTSFADAIGFAFQLCDDVLDATSSVASTGKDVNQDSEMVTFVDLWGVARVRTAINRSIAKAQAIVGAESALSQYVTGLFGNAGLLH